MFVYKYPLSVREDIAFGVLLELFYQSVLRKEEAEEVYIHITKELQWLSESRYENTYTS